MKIIKTEEVGQQTCIEYKGLSMEAHFVKGLMLPTAVKKLIELRIEIFELLISTILTK